MPNDTLTSPFSQLPSLSLFSSLLVQAGPKIKAKIGAFETCLSDSQFLSPSCSGDTPSVLQSPGSSLHQGKSSPSTFLPGDLAHTVLPAFLRHRAPDLRWSPLLEERDPAWSISALAVPRQSGYLGINGSRWGLLGRQWEGRVTQGGEKRLP